MSTTPAPCKPEIFKNGSPVAFVDGSSAPVEKWVQEVARQAEARVDWHYSGGVAQILCLGDVVSRSRVLVVMKKLEDQLDGRVMRYLNQGEKGLYRRGDEDNPLQQVPEDAIGGFLNPLTGEQDFITRPKES